VAICDPRDLIINVFWPVVHRKIYICIFICYINLYKNISPEGVAICDSRDLNNLNILFLRMLQTKYQCIWESG